MPDPAQAERAQHLGMTLRKLRERERLRIKEVAVRMGVKPTSYAVLLRWERGETVPSLISVDRYLTAIGSSFRDFARALEPEPVENSDAARLLEVALDLASDT